MSLIVLALASACRSAERTSVLLIIVDTVRADHVGYYGGKFATPNLDRVALEGAAAEYAVAPIGRTTQSVGTVLTGLHPLRHGADGIGMRLPDSNQTLAERLAGDGYDTAAFTSGNILMGGLGFDQGFKVYSNPKPRWYGDSADTVTDEAIAWLRERPASGRPFFLWAHYFDPHWTYEPPEEYVRKTDPTWEGPYELSRQLHHNELSWGRVRYFADSVLSARLIEHARLRYAAEILVTDAAVGRLLASLDDLGLTRNTLVVLLSDHGESLGEHRYWFGHGEDTYDVSLRVPLFFRAPGTIPAGTSLSGIVRLEDVAPTILDLVGQRVGADMDGRSLAEHLRRGGHQALTGVTAVHLADHLDVRTENPRRPVSGREGRWWAVREDRWKLIRIPMGRGEWQEELYELGKDPTESTNLVLREAATAARLREKLIGLARALSDARPSDAASEPTLDRETLKSLGYVQ